MPYSTGNKPIEKFANWKKIKIHKDLFVTVHPDLEVEQYYSGSNSITLLGFLIDPFNPKLSNYKIIKNISENSKNFKDVLDYTYSLSGRWIIIYNTQNETILLNDLIGLREVYYTEINGKVWCGSDPAILNDVLMLTKKTNQNLKEYMQSDYFRNRENAWFGNKTLYENTYHLLPNHFLNFNEGTTSRFWTNKEKKCDKDKVVKQSSEILEQSLYAANLRYDLVLAVTAGLDSRILLAATKRISHDIYYYVSKMNMRSSHMDIKIPSKLLPKLRLRLNVINNLPQLRDSFNEVMNKNISLFRNKHPRNLTTQYYLDNFSNKVNINGIVSEVGRNFFGLEHPAPSHIDSNYLMKLLEIPLHFSYVKNELDNWLLDAKEFSKKTNLSIIDLFYWEQRMGNWGSLTTNEEDVAIENFMPFNNRKLLMTIMSIDDKYRVAPDYKLYVEIAENLWPEVMSEPINPKSFIRKLAEKIIPNKVKVKFKKISRNIILRISIK